jgi:PAS domain S-box-containing protein
MSVGVAAQPSRGSRSLLPAAALVVVLGAAAVVVVGVVRSGAAAVVGPGAAAIVAALVAAERVLAWRRELAVLRAERDRAAGLFQAALDAHTSVGSGGVETAIIRQACLLLDTDAARFDRSPPGPDELGSRLRSALDPDRWLIASPRPDGRPFDEEDQRTVELLVATTSAAVDNAALFERVEVERRTLADVIGSSSDGIFSLDGAGRVTSWNPAMARITGRRAAEALGAGCGEVFKAWDHTGAAVGAAELREAIGGQPIGVEVLGRRGERRWLECKVSPMPGGGCVVVARDVSAQREVDELKADFLATISHELRTPLTPIQGFLQTLLRDDASFGEAERRRFYEVMLRQSERLERLIRDLLDATSLQDRAHLFFPEEVDWGQAAARVVELFRRQEPNREFTLEVEGGLPRVVVDEQRAEQVLSNLLTNAVKYSPPREPVRVVVRREGAVVVTVVEDRGPGIDESERERVFERFTRLGNHLTRRAGGAGLGLFIARRLVEGMGGTISVDAAPGGGAAFSFSLTVATAAREVAGRSGG